jgi:hypothetical protein
MNYMAAGQDNSTSIKLYSQDPGGGQPAANPAGLPIECSTGSAAKSSPLTHSSSRISPRRSREQKSLTPRSHQVFGIRSGSQGMMAASKGVIPWIKVVAKKDFTKNIEKLDVPIPLLHGDDLERNRAPLCSSHYQDGQKLCC